MHTSGLDKSGPVPLYYQLKNLILDLIDAGELEVGESLPSERELSETYQISRQTVRQAIGELVSAGILTRWAGKGTFVAPRRVVQDLLHVTSFTRLILDWGRTSSVRVQVCKTVVPTPKVSRMLDLRGDSSVIFFERVRLADDEPVAIHRSYIPLALGAELLNTTIDSQSLMGLLEQNEGLRIARSEETMEPTIADDYEADLLGVRLGAPLQLITGRLLSDHDEPVEFHKSVYRGDKFQFAFEGVLDSDPALAQDQHDRRSEEGRLLMR